MRFLQQNSLGGELSVDFLEADTEISSLALAAMTTIAATGGAVMKIVVDPDGIVGEPEVIHVTEHDETAAVATVERGQEGTIARDHPAGIEWIHGGTAGWAEAVQSRVPTVEVTGTAHTLGLVDAGCVVECTNAAAVTVTVPPEADVAWVVGTIINVYAAGAGGVTIAAGAGVTVRNLAAVNQYGEASLRYRGADEWVQQG